LEKKCISSISKKIRICRETKKKFYFFFLQSHAMDNDDLQSKKTPALREIIREHNTVLVGRHNPYYVTFSDSYKDIQHCARRDKIPLLPIRGKKSDLIKRIIQFRKEEEELRIQEEEACRNAEEKYRREKEEKKRKSRTPKAFAVIDGTTRKWETRPHVPSIPPEERVEFIFDKIVQALRREPGSSTWNSRCHVLAWLLYSAWNRLYYFDEYKPKLNYFGKYYVDETDIPKEDKDAIEQGEDPSKFLADKLATDSILTGHLWAFRKKHGVHPVGDVEYLETVYFRFLVESVKPKILVIAQAAMQKEIEDNDTRFSHDWSDYIDQLIYIYRNTVLDSTDSSRTLEVERPDLDECVEERASTPTHKKQRTI